MPNIKLAGKVSAEDAAGENVLISTRVQGAPFWPNPDIVQTDADGNFSLTKSLDVGEYEAQATIAADADYNGAQSPIFPFSAALQDRIITLGLG